jgi:superfamily I DNA/RNA helicase
MSGAKISAVSHDLALSDELNEPQAAAVSHVDGPLLIFAGAGSGKTRVCVYRIAALVAIQRVPPHRILAVTFTNKAADEMKTRLGALLGDDIAKDLWVGTFHSICVRLLRRYHEAAGLGQSFVVYDESDQRTVAARAVREMAPGDKKVSAKKLLAQVSALKQDGKTVADVGEKDQLLRTFFEAYQKQLAAYNAIDFDDILTRVLTLLEDPENQAGKEIAARFRHVLVDEFQDVNQVQYRLVRTLSAQTRNLCVVGDDDQCHPPGVLVGVDRDGSSAPIEELVPTTTVASWNRNAQKMVAGRSVRIAERPFDGELVTVHVGERLVPMTPNHRLLCRWTEPKIIGTCVVYMMWRAGFGFRVGWCQLFNVEGALHVVQRARNEKADRIWILSTFESRTDASIYESVVAAKYGIPTVTFEPVDGAKHLTEESIGRIFALLADENDRRGREALTAFGRAFEFPFYPWPNAGTPDAKFRRGTYFEVFALNVLSGFMSVPLPDGQNTWGVVDAVTRSPYVGPVYSLDVEKDHSYAANGIVVLNSIYGWRGADVRIVRNFRVDFPDAEVVKLEQNYRSTGHVVRSALGVIKPAKEREPKELWTANEDGQEVRVVQCEDERDEAAFVAGRIREAMAAGVEPHDIAVFYRTHAQSRALEEAMMKERVPYQIVGGTRFFERAEIKDTLAYLRALSNPKSNVDVLRIINVPPRKIGDATVERIEQAATEWRKSILESLLDVSHTLAAQAKSAVLGFYELMEKLATQVEGRMPSEVADIVLEASGYRAMLAADESAQSETRQENLKELVGSMVAYEQEVMAALEASKSVRELDYRAGVADGEHSPGPVVAVVDKPTLAGYLERVSLQEETAREEQASRVVLMTVHIAKGLEFDTVFVTGMEEGIFPYQSENLDRESNVEEERRLAYVAITRARKVLWITHAAERSLYGNTRKYVRSFFLSDLPSSSARFVETRLRASARRSVREGVDVGLDGALPGQLSMVPPRSTSLVMEQKPVEMTATVDPGIVLGARVEHATFGTGTVLVMETTADPTVTVRFAGFGPKMIKARSLRPLA